MIKIYTDGSCIGNPGNGGWAAIIIDNGNIENAKHPVSGYKADGIVTKKKNILLGILTADCAPILMADCNAGVIGACHAGWKGAISGIIENTLLEMCKIGAKTKNQKVFQ